MRSSMKSGLAVVAAVLAMACIPAVAQNKKSSERHGIVNSGDLKWTPIISGWEIAVVSGNPDHEGEAFTIRFHGKDGVKVPAHWHPTDENITVLKGAFLVGVGERYDETQLETMSVGSFMTMPQEMRHFAKAKGDTVIQVHGTGPFKVNWVNPAEVLPPTDALK